MSNPYSDPAYRGAYDALFESGQAIVGAAGCFMSPHVLMRPNVFPDGNKWCALYGENIQDGVCGFGDTPALACAAFDLAWHNEKLNPRPQPQEVPIGFFDRLSRLADQGVFVTIGSSSEQGFKLEASWSNPALPHGGGKRFWGSNPNSLLKDLELYMAANPDCFQPQEVK